MKEKVCNGAVENGVIENDEMERRENGVEEAERTRCTEKAPGGTVRRMELRRRDGSRWR